MRGLGSFLIALAAAAAAAQTPAPQTEAARGSALFQLRCSDCHGVDAKGVHGPDLTVLFANGATEDRVFQTIRRGVPGTEMPASNAPDDEIRSIVAYLRTFVTAPTGVVRADTVHGERVFSASCSSCHRVNGRGGALGPDLSRIGASRPRELLAREIRDASAAITPGYQPVTLVLKDGQRIRGARKNEDAYSIQIMDMRQRLQGYVKADLREVINEKASLMPDFKADRLSENDLNDVLGYLGTLRGGSDVVEALRPAETADLKVRTTTDGITSQDLLDGFKNPSRWTMYSGDYTGKRHSPLTQITPQNVSRLTPQWAFQADTIATGRGFESTPLVIDGVIYLTGANGSAWAIDARTGRQFWRFRYPNAPDLTAGATYPVNRGFAALGDQLFMVTLDAHVLSLDMKTGAVVWNAVLEDYRNGYAATPAPLVVKDKVIVGSSGGENPTRGFIQAFDAKTGKRLWRFYTIPNPGEKGSETWPSTDAAMRGGAAAWVTGTYDPELNLVYYGTGNPNPDYYGAERKGDNLYTCSIVALDADTGQLKWYYQFTPHDTHDWDSNHIPVLADVPDASNGGQRRKVVMVANRNGFFYALDRATGKLLVARPFTDTNWAREIGADGRPIVLEEDGTKKCLPDFWGGTNFMPPSFDPALNLFFVTARETCVTYVPVKPEIKVGQNSVGGGVRRVADRVFDYGALRAIDPSTGERKWELRYATPSLSGVMSTASGLVFAGDNEGNFMAVDGRTGKALWHYPTGASIWGAAATTYMLDGRQYVLIPSGTTLVAFALSQL